MKTSTLHQYKIAHFRGLAYELIAHHLFDLCKNFKKPTKEIETKAKVKAMITARKAGSIFLVNLIIKTKTIN